MTPLAAEPRPFEPGTTGWTAQDLDDPRIEALWFQGRYEIVEGVLTTMPPAYFAGGNAIANLVFLLKTHLKGRGVPGRLATELDLTLEEARVAVADLAFLTPEDQSRQIETARQLERADVGRTRTLVPPTLIVESVSTGHEAHDRRTKRRWYAEFGVPNYWLLDVFGRSLECLVLDGGAYRADASGRGDEEVTPSLFPGLVLRLAEVWDD